MTYNKPAIPKGTRYFMNTCRYFVVENQLLIKHLTGILFGFCILIYVLISVYFGTFRYISVQFSANFQQIIWEKRR